MEGKNKLFLVRFSCVMLNSSMDVGHDLMLLLLRGNIIQVQPLCEVHKCLGSLKDGQSSWSLMG